MRSPHHLISLHFEAVSKIQVARSHTLQEKSRSTDLYNKPRTGHASFKQEGEWVSVSMQQDFAVMANLSKL
jgi:hypothetical protein